MHRLNKIPIFIGFDFLGLSLRTSLISVRFKPGIFLWRKLRPGHAPFFGDRVSFATPYLRGLLLAASPLTYYHDELPP
jgi:hypothetical protein